MREKGLKILVLEDEPADAALMKAELVNAEFEFEFELCTTGEAFEEQLKSFDFDLVLSDFSLPGYDGHLALKSVRNLNQEVPFIFITGTLREEDAIKALRAGATDFMLKSELDKLPANIMRILRQKHLQDQQKAEELRFRSLIENSNEGILLLDDELRVSFFNQPSCRMLNLKSEDLHHLQFLHLVPEAHQGAFVEAIDQVKQLPKEVATVESELFINHGNTRWFSIKISNQKHVDGLHSMVINLEDIHDQKGMADLLSQREQRFKFLVKESNEFRSIIKPNGIIDYCSESIFKIMGYDVNQFEGQSLFNVIHQKDVTNIKRMIVSLEPGSHLELPPFRMQCAKGQWRWIKSTVSNHINRVEVGGIVLNGVDHTAMINQAIELQESYERYRFASKASQDIIYDWNVKTGKVVRDEEALKKMLGYTLKDVDEIHDFWKHVTHQDDYKRVFEHLRESLNNQYNQFYNVEYRVRRSDGTHAYVDDKGYIIRDNRGNAVRVVGALRDISSQRTRELQLNLINELKTELSAHGNIQQCLSNAIKVLGKKVGLAMAEAWLISIDRSSLNLIASWDNKNPNEVAYVSHLGELTNFEFGQGLPGAVWKDGVIDSWANLPNDPRFLRSKEALNRGLRGAIGIPVLFAKEVMAVIVVFVDDVEESLEEVLSLLETLPNDLGGELHSKRIETELNSIFEMSADLLCIAGTDGYFKKINPSFSRLLGYTDEELLSRPYVEFVHPDDRYTTKVEANELASGLATIKFENRYITKEGREVWLQWSSQPAPESELIYAIARDNTEKKRVQMQLTESYERLQTAHEVAKLGYWSFDVKTGHTEWNDGMYDLWEQDPNTFDPKQSTVLPLIHPEDHHLISHFDATRSSGKSSNRVKYRVVLGKNTKWILDIIQFERDDNGRTLRLKGVSQDITEQHNQLKSIEDQNQRLKEIAWLQSHKVRAPLARILSLIQYIGTLDPHEKELEEMLKHLNMSAEELDEIIKEIINRAYPISKMAEESW